MASEVCKTCGRSDGSHEPGCSKAAAEELLRQELDAARAAISEEQRRRLQVGGVAAPPTASPHEPRSERYEDARAIARRGQVAALMAVVLTPIALLLSVLDVVGPGGPSALSFFVWLFVWLPITVLGIYTAYAIVCCICTITLAVTDDDRPGG